MSKLMSRQEGAQYLLMGNEAIVRGALEAGVRVAAGYPGTPSSEIIENFAKVAQEANLYVEWSVNEKLSMEVAAAGSFANLRSLCAMKQNGVNVASDFLLHLAGSGTRGGMVLVSCEDPGALSSVNEGDSRHFARMVEIPLLEPGNFQEAKDMTRWAFELSEELGTLVMIRSVTRLSHASGNVVFGSLSDELRKAEFKYDGFILDPKEGTVVAGPVGYKHGLQQDRIRKAREIYEKSPFNIYEGPQKPEVLIITSSACYLYSREAIHLMNLEDSVGLLKLGTTWPLPTKLVKKYLLATEKILIVEEVIPFIEEGVKVIAAETADEIGIKTFFAKNDGTIASIGELNTDAVIAALGKILSISYTMMSEDYEKKAQTASFAKAPVRELTFCPGCPHRASFWNIHQALQMDHRQGFVCGDIGCYTLALLPCGFSTIKIAHAMGSGIGVASGFGQLKPFGMDQPVLAVCGDSTFYHAVIPGLINAIHHRADLTLVVLDNSGTAMTGFQPHPGLEVNAMGRTVPSVDIAKICEAMGAHVETHDPFNLTETREALNTLMEKKGCKVLILKQKCALSPEKRAKKHYEVHVEETRCLGDLCGCNRLCTRIFCCPALFWDKENKKTRVDEVLCAGCGVCASICPEEAIWKQEVV